MNKKRIITMIDGSSLHTQFTTKMSVKGKKRKSTKHDLLQLDDEKQNHY